MYVCVCVFVCALCVLACMRICMRMCMRFFGGLQEHKPGTSPVICCVRVNQTQNPKNDIKFAIEFIAVRANPALHLLLYMHLHSPTNTMDANI